MTHLRDTMAHNLNMDIELACLQPDEFTDKLLANGMSDTDAYWVANYQHTTSDPLLSATTQVLSKILGRQPLTPQLISHGH